MAWWGTLIGGTLGYMIGGPLGAALGAVLGRNFDSGITLDGSQSGYAPGQQERVQAAFFTATFSVMGHVAKADGQVSKDEISSARSIMDQMQLDAEQRKAAIGLFNEGKKSDFPLHDVLLQFRLECHRRKNLLRVFMEIQIATAMADGHVHRDEKKLILEIGRQLGFQPGEIEGLFRFTSSSRAYTDDHHTLAEAYSILGVDKSATDPELKKAYRRLMSQHHPDRLIAKGLPDEMIKLATEKTQKIKAAYEQVRESRK